VIGRGRQLAVAHRIAQLYPDTDPRSISQVVEEQRPRMVQFDAPLPDSVLAATADALRSAREVALRAYGRAVDPSLGWLHGFEGIERLTIDLWHVTSFDALASLPTLRELSLGQTLSRRPSLDVLHALDRLELLHIEAHDRGFDAVSKLVQLRQLHLRVPRVKTLNTLRGHPRLEVLAMHFGGIRDLAPLADLPALRAFEAYQIRSLQTEDLAPVGECRSLVAVSLGASTWSLETTTAGINSLRPRRRSGAAHWS
jgi:hypothetical protein